MARPPLRNPRSRPARWGNRAAAGPRHPSLGIQQAEQRQLGPPAPAAGRPRAGGPAQLGVTSVGLTPTTTASIVSAAPRNRAGEPTVGAGPGPRTAEAVAPSETAGNDVLRATVTVAPATAPTAGVRPARAGRRSPTSVAGWGRPADSPGPALPPGLAEHRLIAGAILFAHGYPTS